MSRTKTSNIPFVVIMLIAAGFGFWFAFQQLHAVSNASAATASYPSVYLFITAIKCFFTILVIFGISYLLLYIISRHKISGLWVAFSFLPLLLLVSDYPKGIILGLIVALQIAGLLFVWRSKDYDIFRKKYLVDAVALLVLFILHLIITTQFSPLHLKKALFTKFSEEIPVQAPLYKGFSLAKQFVFSTFDHSEWAAVVNPPITLASPLSQLITFLFNLPSIDPVTFHVVIDSITFLLIVGGAFGCYLFLKYAAKVCSILSWFGGALMFFSAANYLWLMIWADGGIFLSSYAMLPYCLLFLTLACEKRRYYLAAWAGVAMASPFFILTPHPEGVIYTALC
jgi:hypothetical protein